MIGLDVSCPQCGRLVDLRVHLPEKKKGEKRASVGTITFVNCDQCDNLFEVDVELKAEVVTDPFGVVCPYCECPVSVLEQWASVDQKVGSTGKAGMEVDCDHCGKLFVINVEMKAEVVPPV